MKNVQDNYTLLLRLGAAEAFSKAVALNPDSPQAHFESGKLEVGR